MMTKVYALINRIYYTDIVKVFTLTALSTVVKMLTGFVSVKTIAIIIGPDGIALMGQLSNFATIVMAVSLVGISNGVTKYIAEYRNQDAAFKKLLSTALIITIYGTSLCGLFLIFASKWLGKLIFLSDQWSYIFPIFGFTIFCYSINQLFLSIINGQKDFKKFVKISIANSIVGLIFTLILVFYWDLEGALIGMVTFHSIMLFVTLWYIRNEEWFSFKYFKDGFDKSIARKYSHYSLMTLITVAVVPVSQLVLRGHVIADISITEAGWWEGMNRLSGAYLMVITSSFSVYYLPRLSELKERHELHHEIFKAYSIVIPMILVGFSFIFLFRFIIIRLLFSPEFLPMNKLFIWQLIGDVFRISSWLLAYLMIAKAKTFVFITTELLFTALNMTLSFIFLTHFGIVGLTQAAMVTYILYMITMVVIFRKIIFLR